MKSVQEQIKTIKGKDSEYRQFIALCHSLAIIKLFEEFTDELISGLKFDGAIEQQAIYRVAQYEFVRAFKVKLLTLLEVDDYAKLQNLLFESENG
jgi:hypothetical protein